MGFGNRLKKILKEKGITIKELGEISGLSVYTLYSITKRDTQMPSQEIINKIATALKIDASLLTYEFEKEIIENSLNNMNQIEQDFRNKLFEITEMLNADAISILLNNAIDMLQHDSYRSVFFKKHDDKN